jgi:hypothetical protein
VFRMQGIHKPNQEFSSFFKVGQRVGFRNCSRDMKNNNELLPVLKSIFANRETA